MLDAFQWDESLLPRTDLKERSKIDALLDWNGTTVRPTLGGLLIKVIFTPMFGGPEATEEERKQLMDKILDLYKEIDEILSHHAFLANDNLTIADVQIYNEIILNQAFFKYEFTDYPNLIKWKAKMEEDPVLQEMTELMFKRLEELKFIK